MGSRGFQVRAAIATAAMAIGLAATGIAISGGPAASPVASTRRDVGVSPTAGSVASLRSGTWAALPRSPLGPRSDAVTAWTGKEFVVVGGDSLASARTPLSGAAAYTPATGRWTKLPPFPLTARDAAATVWTGSSVVIWGGETSSGSPLGSGAAFDPVAARWQVMASSPLPALGGMVAVPTGRGDALVLGGDLPSAATSAQDRDFVSRTAALYDPARNSWTEVPPVPAVRGHSLVEITAGRLGKQILVAAGWQHAVRITPNSGEFKTGTDLFLFDPTTRRWHTHATLPRDVPVLGADVEKVGAGTVIAGGTTCLPDESCPLSLDSPFAVLSSSGHVQDGPLPPVQQRVAASTGLAYAITSGTSIGGPHHTERPGDSAIYDPVKRQWTLLPSAARFHPDPESLTWTGSQLILWTAHGGIALRHS